MLDKIKRLPNELINKIYNYVSHSTLMFLTKKNYDKYHLKVLKNSIETKNKNIHNYLRFIIRYDNHIALKDVMCNLNKLNLKNHNKIIYKNKKYDILDYLICLCIENEKQSTKCKHIIMNYNSVSREKYTKT